VKGTLHDIRQTKRRHCQEYQGYRGDGLTTGEKPGALAQWAFFTSLFVVIGLAGMYRPPLYIFAAILLPLPAMLLVLRVDVRCGMLGLAAAGLIFSTLIPLEAVFLLVIQYGLLGIIYGVLFKNRDPSARILSAGMLYAVVSAFLYPVLSYLLTGNNLFILGEDERRSIEQMMAAYQEAGAFNDIPAEWQGDAGARIISFFELFIPGQYIVHSAAVGAVTYFLARPCLQRLHYFLSPGLVFTAIALPWYSVWGPIAGLTLTLAGDQFLWLLGAKAGKNILFIFFCLYSITGLSVAAYFFRKINLAWFLKLIFLVFAVVYTPFSIMIIILLGVTDPLVNFRRLHTET
jgi:uncharacterized protein YybS (DUF2232 family)